MTRQDKIEQLAEACAGRWSYVQRALDELFVQYVDDVADFDFLLRRIEALREEDIIYDWENEP